MRRWKRTRQRVGAGALVAVLLFLSGSLAVAPASAVGVPHAGVIQLTADDVHLDGWMGELAPRIDNRPLDTIAMPGSHDAGSWGIHAGSGLCRTGGTYQVSAMWPSLAASMAITQRASLVDQLNAGSRYLDLRLCYQDGVWRSYHGSPMGSQFFDSQGGAGEFDQLAGWLDSHPTEIVTIALHLTAPADELPQDRRWALEQFTSRLTSSLAPQPGSASGLGPDSTYGQFMAAGKHVVLVDSDDQSTDSPLVWPSGSSDGRGSYAQANAGWQDYVAAFLTPGATRQHLIDSTLSLNDAALLRPAGAQPALFTLSSILTTDLTVPNAAMAQLSPFSDGHYLLDLADQLNAQVVQRLRSIWEDPEYAAHMNIVTLDDVNQQPDVTSRSVIALNEGHLSSAMSRVATGDFNGDGRSDVVAAENSTGDLYLYPGTGAVDSAFAVGAPIRIGAGGWNQVGVVAMGDLNGDGRSDLVVQIGADLYLYPGTGQSGLQALGARVLIGNGGWNQMGDIGVGDFSGDGRPDVVAMSEQDGNLYLYANTGLSGLQTLSGRTLIGAGGWNHMTDLTVGDVTGDGRPDVVAEQDGDLYAYPATGLSGLQTFANRDLLGHGGWDQMSGLAVGDFTGDGTPDLLAQPDTGDLLVYPLAGTNPTVLNTPMKLGGGRD